MRRIPKTPAAPRRPGVDLAYFDLNLLRTLDALLVTRSVSGAALRLGLSQPATSAALARVRAALHDLILVRRGNRMQPTALAEELHPRVERILREIGETLGATATFAPATTTRRFRIGANDHASAVLLAPLTQRVLAAAPHAALEVIACDTAPELSLATRETDLVIADRWSLRDIPTVEALFHETFISIARVDHPRLSRRPTLEEFLAADHALLSPRGILPGVLDAALEKLGRARRVALTLPHYLAAPGIIANTDLVMTLPRGVVLRAGAVGLRTFAPPLATPGFDVVMACHQRGHSEPAVQWLMREVRAIAAGGLKMQSAPRTARGA
jgi:DNA-binding transcriptional LysR family regulator